MPNNNIKWGQGSVNNTIGWGAGAATNSKLWGSIHKDSYGHDETNLVGNYGSAMAIVLKADGGTILSLPCLDVLGAQIYDPDALYYNWDVAINVLETDGGTEIDRACGLTLAKQIF